MLPNKQITYMPNKISLYCHIAKRTFTMLSRRKKSIRLLQLDHQPVDGHEGLIMLKFKFSNAIYYNIGGNKVVKQHVIMQKPTEGQQIPFTVFGLSKQNDYVLSVAGGDIVLTRIVQKSRVLEPVRNMQHYYPVNLAHN